MVRRRLKMENPEMSAFSINRTIGTHRLATERNTTFSIPCISVVVALVVALVVVVVVVVVVVTRRYCRCTLKGGQFVSSIAYTADFFPSCLRNVPIDSLAKGLDSLVGRGFAPWPRGRGFEPQPSIVRDPTGWVGVSIMDRLRLLITVLYIPVELTYSYVMFSGDHMLTKQHSTMAFALLTAALSEVGIVLYNPLGLGWDQTEVTYVNLAGIHFLWHLLANLAVAMTTSTITALAFRQAIDNNSGET
ncbi:hypothetical protein ElyMa_007039200 [Elysia marginata]|uniref:Uncharacterized protein n=1 Tax=Elysia marginata TaxID=1093978 RepID=A0AAV4JTC7_9GAST|nr:hypothetical protein ElyMa_007039200 [Elysia marginata]